MTSPVNRGPIPPYVPHTEESTTEFEEGKDDGSLTETDLEVKTKKEMLEREFCALMKDYDFVQRRTAGDLELNQRYATPAWQKVQNFINKHPEFEDRAGATKFSLIEGISWRKR